MRKEGVGMREESLDVVAEARVNLLVDNNCAFIGGGSGRKLEYTFYEKRVK